MSGVFRLRAPELTRAQMTSLGAESISAMQDRLDKRLNLADQRAKPYSPRGPIYMPISGVGSFWRGPGRGLAGPSQFVRRNKSTLRGANVFTRGDLRKMSSRGTAIIVSTKRGSSAMSGTSSLGVPFGGRTASKKSIKFLNYAHYKRALGKSGERDLEVSGRMRGSIAIVRFGRQSIEIGFTREKEHQKAQGNQKREPWFGLSPGDRGRVAAMAVSFLPEVAAKMPERRSG